MSAEQHERDPGWDNSNTTIQYSFFPSNVLPLGVEDTDLDRETEPVFEFGQTIIHEHPSRGIRINISDIETLVPAIQAFKDGEHVYLPHTETDSSREASHVGIRLHELDVLISLIVQGAEIDKIGHYLPTFTEERLIPYREVLNYPAIPTDGTISSLRSRLIDAWGIYQRIRGNDTGGSLPMYAGMGLPNSQKDEAVLTSRTMFEMGERLIDAWIGYIGRNEHDMWEFRPRSYTQREVMVVMNLTCGLQVVSMIDSITRPLHTHDKVKSQIVDFKTGANGSRDPWQTLIQKRQAQMMTIMAEHVTAKFLTGNRVFDPGESAIRFRANHTNAAVFGRSSFGYCWFDKELGPMDFEPLPWTKDERKGFASWVSEFARDIHKYQSYVRRVLGRKT